MCPRVSHACHCLLPALARPRQSEEGAWGQGEHLSSHEPVTSTLRHPRVTCEAAGCVSRRVGVPPANRGPVVRTEHGPLAAPVVTARVPSGQGC